jgi:hypothetical protein
VNEDGCHCRLSNQKHHHESNGLVGKGALGRAGECMRN